MADTFLQIHLHVVFAVRYRQALILDPWRDRVHQYIIGMFHHHDHRVLAINSMPDHIHILFGYNVNQLLPRLMQEIKRDSTQWINKQGFTQGRFAWQNGYGAFAVNKRGIPAVATYIKNQQQHHQRQSMREEFAGFLDAEEIVYKPEYIFCDPE